MLSYGRERRVILDAPLHDHDCVLANILAAHFLFSADPSRAPFHFQAAKYRLVCFLRISFSQIVCQGYLYLTSFIWLGFLSFWWSKLLSTQAQATPYERAVFEAINSLVSENRDDDVAIESHAKVEELFYWVLLTLAVSSNFPVDSLDLFFSEEKLGVSIEWIMQGTQLEFWCIIWLEFPLND